MQFDWRGALQHSLEGRVSRPERLIDLRLSEGRVVVLDRLQECRAVAELATRPLQSKHLKSYINSPHRITYSKDHFKRK